MSDIMARAKERADAFRVRDVLVATNTGASLAAAMDAFGPDYRFFAVGNPASAHERGLVLHDGISNEVKATFEAKGVTVVLQNQSLFQRPGLSLMGASLDAVVQSAAPTGRFRAMSIVYSALQLFGDGPRVCLEIAMMAADSGHLPLDEDCISIACPSSYCDLPDAAVVLRPAKSQDMFSEQHRIKDLILCPTPNDVWFSNGPLP